MGIVQEYKSAGGICLYLLRCSKLDINSGGTSSSSARCLYATFIPGVGPLLGFTKDIYKKEIPRIVERR